MTPHHATRLHHQTGTPVEGAVIATSIPTGIFTGADPRARLPRDYQGLPDVPAMNPQNDELGRQPLSRQSGQAILDVRTEQPLRPEPRRSNICLYH